VNLNHQLRGKWKSGDGGFTLLEVIVAMAILAFGLLAVASMQVASIRGNAFAGGATQGSTWAADQMEKLMALPYNDADLVDADGDGAAGLNQTGFDNDPTTLADADHGITQGRFTVHWNIADNQLINNTKTVCVIATWADHGFQKRAILQSIKPRID
jgi:prepilin-type N-terminal cleavage/methylation domain-containing protein